MLKYWWKGNYYVFCLQVCDNVMCMFSGYDYGIVKWFDNDEKLVQCNCVKVEDGCGFKQDFKGCGDVIEEGMGVLYDLESGQ